MKRFSLYISILSLVCGFLFSSCVYTPVKGSNENARLDRQYLEFWYNSQLLPAFEYYESQVQLLHQALDEATPEHPNPEKLRQCFHSALLALQPVIIFDDLIFANHYYGLSGVSAAFPVNVSSLEDLMSRSIGVDEISQGINLGTISPNSVGFAALDYLLYTQTAESMGKHLQFMRSISTLLLQQAHDAVSHYRENTDDFLANDGFGIHGSVSLLMNTLLRNWETNIRTAKIGYPIGIYGIVNHDPAPHTAEAYYSGLSSELLKRSIVAFRDFYTGVPARKALPRNAELSFRNMLLEYLPQMQNEDIVKRIDKELAQLDVLLSAVKTDIPGQIQMPEGLIRLQAIHASLQRVVGLLKTNAVTALGLTITYSDGEEGD